MVHEFLRGFFVDETLHFEEITSNLENDDTISRHSNKMNLLARQLAR